MLAESASHECLPLSGMRSPDCACVRGSRALQRLWPFHETGAGVSDRLRGTDVIRVAIDGARDVQGHAPSSLFREIDFHS